MNNKQTGRALKEVEKRKEFEKRLKKNGGEVEKIGIRGRRVRRGE